MEDLEDARQLLLRDLRREVRDERVLRALEKVPRERFVPPESRQNAYANAPLPIGEGQTISQPLIVALSCSALSLQGDEQVLEVGTGSGYQAAVLSHLCRWVVTVERFPSLAEAAEGTLRDLGIRNAEVHVAGEVLGWPPGAPYDAIVVAAASPRVPQALLDQLRDGGRMVVPVGTRIAQELLVVTRRGERITRESLGGCRFVPLVGDEAWEEDES